jgi:uncharacterized repeat protein (TIGR04138 family)
MQSRDPEQTIDEIVRQDPRYAREAYDFIREAVAYTLQRVSRQNQGKPRHIRGPELLAGVRDYALEQFGPMTLDLLHEWGIHRCEDIGEIVFNLVDHQIFSKTDEDSRADFQNGYDFEQTFRQPFKPSRLPNDHPRPPRSPAS